MPARVKRVCKCGAVLSPGQSCAACAAPKKQDTRPSPRKLGYDTKWDKARRAYLQRHPSCAMCGARANVVDHIIPHRRDMALFWSKKNWQPLCTPCHCGPKQAQEKKPRFAVSPDGTPTDPDHPWNKGAGGVRNLSECSRIGVIPRARVIFESGKQNRQSG